MRVSSLLIVPVLVLGCASGQRGHVTPDMLLEQSTATVQQVRSEQEALGYFLERCEGALVFPTIKRGALVFGAIGGSGVLVERRQSGWTAPMFVDIGGVNFGVQAGVESAQVVVVIMNRRLIELVRGGILDFGVGAGVALGPADLKSVGSLQTSDAYVFRSGEGVYGGLTVDSAVVKPDTAQNAAFQAGGPNSAAATLFAALAGAKKTP